MFFKGNHIRKVISAGLLIILLLIHSVKLLHSHSSKHIGKIDRLSDSAIVNKADYLSASTDCGVCSYHLTKDAEAIFQFNFTTQKINRKAFTSRIISFLKDSFLFVFETRGPPQIA